MLDATRAAFGTRVRHLLPSSLRRAAARMVADRRAADVERHLDSLARGARPIVAGPWLGEVGFELLYWVPFLRWFSEHYRIPSERLIVVSRGGSSTWYAPFAGASHDALALMSPDEFRRKNDGRRGRLGEQKQIASTALDDEVLDAVRLAEGRDVAVLHPSLMYGLFAPYWWGHRGVDWVHRYARFAPLPGPALDVPLPSGYTAVKFYFNDCFRAAPEHRAFVERTIRRLADEGPVVSLSTGLAVDDHAPCAPDVASMQDIRHLLDPQSNLLVQSAIVARARRFVGTYGGFAYLAPLYGVPSVSYYTHPGTFSLRHLDLMRDILTRAGRAELLEVREAGEGVPLTPPR